MAVIGREELDRLLKKIEGYHSNERTSAANEIRKHFEQARQALAEHEALNRNLQKQTDEKVDLQVRVRELERELQKVPPVQPYPTPTTPWHHGIGVRGWNETDPNAPFAPVFSEPRVVTAQERDERRNLVEEESWGGVAPIVPEQFD